MDGVNAVNIIGGASVPPVGFGGFVRKIFKKITLILLIPFYFLFVLTISLVGAIVNSFYDTYELIKNEIFGID